MSFGFADKGWHVEYTGYDVNLGDVYDACADSNLHESYILPKAEVQYFYVKDFSSKFYGRVGKYILFNYDNSYVKLNFDGVFANFELRQLYIVKPNKIEKTYKDINCGKYIVKPSSNAPKKKVCIGEWYYISEKLHPYYKWMGSYQGIKVMDNGKKKYIIRINGQDIYTTRISSER